MLDCPADGVPEPTILWFVNGVPLDPESQPGITVSESGQRLMVTSTKVSDAGMYTCIAANEAGEAEQVFELDVWGKKYKYVWSQCELNVMYILIISFSFVLESKKCLKHVKEITRDYVLSLSVLMYCVEYPIPLYPVL